MQHGDTLGILQRCVTGDVDWTNGYVPEATEEGRPRTVREENVIVTGDELWDEPTCKVELAGSRGGGRREAHLGADVGRCTIARAGRALVEDLSDRMGVVKHNHGCAKDLAADDGSVRATPFLKLEMGIARRDVCRVAEDGKSRRTCIVLRKRLDDSDTHEFRTRGQTCLSAPNLETAIDEVSHRHENGGSHGSDLDH